MSQARKAGQLNPLKIGSHTKALTLMQGIER